MTIIKVSCPSCGEIELGPTQLKLVVNRFSAYSFYTFTCEQCTASVRSPAGADVVQALTMGGIVAERIDMPAEAAEHHDGPAADRGRRARLRGLGRVGHHARRGRRRRAARATHRARPHDPAHLSCDH